MPVRNLKMATTHVEVFNEFLDNNKIRRSVPLSIRGNSLKSFSVEQSFCL